MRLQIVNKGISNMEAEQPNSQGDNTSSNFAGGSESKNNEPDIEQTEKQPVEISDTMLPCNTENMEDIELFEQLISSWKSQEVQAQILENELKQKVQCLEKREKNYKTRISDLETTNELMEKTINGIHNELDLVDKLKKDLDSKQEQIKSLESQVVNLKQEIDDQAGKFEQQAVQNWKDHEKEMEILQVEIFGKLREKDKEINDVLAMKNSEVEQLRKDKNIEINKMMETYEGKLAALQEEKMTALMDQQRRLSSHQELMRQKFEYSQRQYETEISQLKDQLTSRMVQKPGPSSGNRRSAPKPSVVARPIFKKAKNF